MAVFARRILSASDKPRPPAGPPTVYWVHREGESFAADGLDTLLKWAQAGKIAPGDHVMHPALDSWFQASESAALLAAMPDGIRQGHIAVLPIVLDPLRLLTMLRSWPMSRPSQIFSRSGHTTHQGGWQYANHWYDSSGRTRARSCSKRR